MTFPVRSLSCPLEPIQQLRFVNQEINIAIVHAALIATLGKPRQPAVIRFSLFDASSIHSSFAMGKNCGRNRERRLTEVLR